MSRARASIDLPEVRISQVEALWYDRARWQGFVDGLHHVELVEGAYPESGARVVWASHPGGRGRVIERVISYEPRVGQTLAMEDERTTGTQSVAFSALEDGARVALELDYAIRTRLGELVPVTQELDLRRVWAATIDYTPDHLPILGPALDARREPIAGVTVASPGGHGMMWGPAVARVAADLALRGTSEVTDASFLGPDRFDEHGASTIATDPIALPFPETVGS